MRRNNALKQQNMMKVSETGSGGFDIRVATDVNVSNLGSHAKKNAHVYRRSEMEYFSSLQTAASAKKFAQEEDLLSSQKTVDQRRRDRYDDENNMKT